MELPTELIKSGAINFFAKEVTNWHRDGLFSILGTIFHTLHDQNEVLSETQTSLFASLLLSQSFGYFSWYELLLVLFLNTH